MVGKLGTVVVGGVWLVLAAPALAAEPAVGAAPGARRAQLEQRAQQPRVGTPKELELLGRILMVDTEGVYLLDGAGVITKLALTQGTRFEGKLRGSGDLETGQQVRARYALRGGDGVATRVQLISAPDSDAR